MSDTPKAMDGRALPAVHTFAQFLQLMEDGELHGELSDHLQQINAALSQHVIDYGGKAKGKLTLTVNFTLNKGVFEITGGYTVKLPDKPRGQTVVWATPDNRFTPHNPRQMAMFGVRDVTPEPAETEIINT